MSAVRPINVLVANVEDPFHRLFREQVVSGGGVLDPLGLAGRAAGVEDEQRGFAVHRLGGADGRGLGHEFVPPEVAAFAAWSTSMPTRRTTTHFSTVGDFSRARSVFCFSGTCLPRRQPASAVIISLAEASLLRSAMASAENPPKTTEWTAPIRAGQHGDGKLGNHRHVQRDHVALADAQRLEHVGELAHFRVQHLVGEHAGSRPARLPR